MRGLSSVTGAILLCGVALSIACGAAESVNDAESGDDGCPRIVQNGGDTIRERPDGESLCPDGVCNYVSQDGCPSNQACRPALDSSGAIIPSCQGAGTRTNGETCANANDCEPGYACPDGQCRKLCCGRDWSESACDEGYGCYRDWSFLVNDVATPTGAYLCFPTGCDIFTSDDCPSGRDCKIIDPRGTTACVPPSPERLGERCTPPSVCGRGLACVGQPGEEVCRRLCRAEECGEPACRLGEGTCVHFNRDPPGVGECTPGWPAP